MTKLPDGIMLNWIAPDSTRHFEEEDRSPEEIVRAVARRHRDRAAPYTGDMNEIPQQLLMPSVHDASLAGSREGMAFYILYSIYKSLTHSLLSARKGTRHCFQSNEKVN